MSNIPIARRRQARRPIAGACLPLLVLCFHAGVALAVDTITPSFQGSAGSSSMSAGAHDMAFSAPQLAASTIMSGLHSIQNGFFATLDSNASNSSPPPLPGQPGVPAGTVLGISSITWTWTAATYASSYIVHPATNPAAVTATTTTLAFIQAGLLTNTSYGILIQGQNASGLGLLSSTAAVYTLALPPTGSAASLVTSTVATVSWALNGNPTGTTAEVQRSTNNTVFSSVLTFAGLSYTAYDLLGCTSYYLRVRNKNGDGLATSFDSTVNFLTSASTPSAPSSLTAEPLAGNKIALSWVGSPTEGISQYKLYEVGTGTGSYGSAVAVFTSTETSFTTGVLAAGTHGFALRAVHRCGVEEFSGTFASAASIAVISSVRTIIKSPNTGKRIRGNSVTIIAELVSGNPVDVGSVTFQIKPAAGAVWTNIVAANINHPNPDLEAPYFIQWNADANALGQYDLRAVAMNVAGSSDTSPSSIRVTLVAPAGQPGTDYDIKEDVGSKEQVVNTQFENTISAAGAGADDPAIKISLPAGALSGSTVTVQVAAMAAITTAAPSGFSLVGPALQIDLLNSGQSVLNAPATLTLSYPVAAGSPAYFQIQSFDPATGLWSAIGAPTIDTTNKTVSAATPHFSLFAIIAGAGGPQADLSRVRVYPNPFKPNGGNPTEGRPYNSGDALSGIIFDRLPAAVSLKIYSISGRLVAQFETTVGNGAIQWDAKNADGRQVASGGYFAVIASPGNKSVVKRLAIIR